MSTIEQTRSAPRPSPEGQVQADARRLYPLQWLRALAALSVLTFHAYQHQRSGPESTWPLQGGWHQLMTGTDLFVDMFFVLSSFVLWMPVARDAIAQRDGRPGPVVLFRRMARLAPLYVTVVLIVWAITNPSLPGHWKDLLLHLTFTQVYSNTYIFWTDGPAWSLAVEFHFYLLIALAIPLVQRWVRHTPSRGQRIAKAMALPAALAVAGGTYLWWQITVNQPAAENYVAWFNPLAKAPDFALGMTLAVLCAAGVRLGAATRTALATMGLGALALLVFTRPLESITLNAWHPMYAAAIAVTLSAIVLHDGPWPAWMSWRPLAWVGGLGYGIYLIHEPTLRLLDHIGVIPAGAPGAGFLGVALLLAIPSIALAWLSSRTVEAGGLKLLHLIDGQGRSRNYYSHPTQ